MHSIHLNDCEHTTGALAISELVNHAEKQRNGERTGFVMLELIWVDEKWFVVGVEFRSEEAGNKQLEQFLKANPKSIDLPPLTPNSLPSRNPVEADQQSIRWGEPVNGLRLGAKFEGANNQDAMQFRHGDRAVRRMILM